MGNRFCLMLSAIAILATAVSAQHPAEASHGRAHAPQMHQGHPPPANQGRIPTAPSRRDTQARAEQERNPNGHVNGPQHVNNDHWYGHDAPNDKRYHLDHPFEHGLEVASWDWFICANWCRDCGDDFVVYGDPDHPGWYLQYNVHTGAYVHVTYLGT